MTNICHKILLIEDDVADAELIREMAESKEAQCVVQGSDRLSSALKLLREDAFEVVLLDLGLPDSSGLDTLQRLLDEGPPLPIIVLTVTADEELAAKAISMGAQDYLVKGRFDADLLYRAMLYALERKKYDQQLKESAELLRQAYAALEKRVEERTAELKKAYEKLQEEMSERLKAEEQFRQAQKMEAIGTFTGGIAHDFNNILAAIIGFTELVLGNTAKESPDRHHLENVLEAGLRGRDLVKRLLAFSKKSERRREPVHLSNAIKETTKLLRASIPTTIDINVRIESESGPVLCDPVQIQQVIMNLCANAIDAMREKVGTLEIELSDFKILSTGDNIDIRPGSYMRLSVTDTGTGIPPEILPRIFDPFVTTKENGTGLGLSVVQGIIRSFDGVITVESKVGKGSTFRIYLPVVDEKQVREKDAKLDVPRGTERILFVDDEEMLVEMAGQIIVKLGYTVTGMTSGEEALEAFRKDSARFDLVITDQTMPGITGVRLSEEILKIRGDIPLILFTGHSDAVSPETAKEVGIREVLMKPLTKHELAQAIRRALDARNEE